MRHRWTWPAVAAVAVAVLGLAACGGSTGTGAATTSEVAPGTGSAAPTPSVGGSSHPGTVCRAIELDPNAANAARVRLNPAFVPVTVIRCRVTQERVAGQGEWTVLVEERATSPITAFVTALRAPDEPPAAQTCTAQLDLDPEVWLLDTTGRAVLPRWPRDSCHHLVQSTMAALDALSWKPAVRARLRQTASQAAIDAGCETSWKYLFDLGGAGTPKPGTLADLAGTATARLCRYARSADDPMRGDFESGRAISTAAWPSLQAALEAAPPARSCTARATRFAVISVAGGGYAEIELDGCNRIATSDGGLRHATPSLLTLLT